MPYSLPFGFIGQEFDVEGCVMRDQGGIVDESTQIVDDFRKSRHPPNHPRRNSSYVRDEGRNRALWINERTQFSSRLAVDDFTSRNLDNLCAFKRGKAGGLEIQDNKSSLRIAFQRIRPPKAVLR